MARLIVWNLMTLDGRFEGSQPWDLGWHPRGPELEQLGWDQLHSAGGLVFGRKTYQGMADYWKSATGAIAERMNSLPKAVVSQSMKSADWEPTRIFSCLDAVGQWKAETSQDLYVFGSAELVTALLAAGWVDEVRIGLASLVLGSGRPLFPTQPRRDWTLLEAKALGTACLLLRYGVKK